MESRLMLSKNTAKIIAEASPSAFRINIFGPLPPYSKVGITDNDIVGNYALTIMIEQYGELRELLSTDHIFLKREKAADYWAELLVYAKVWWQTEQMKRQTDKRLRQLEKIPHNEVQDKLLWSQNLADGF